MPIASFVFCAMSGDIPAPHRAGAVSEEETIAGASVATTASSGGGQGFCEVTVDIAAFVSFGTSPNAGTDQVRFFIPAGQTRYFRVKQGDKGAVIAA